MKFYRDLFDASLNRVLPENDKRHFFETFWETFVHMSPGRRWPADDLQEFFRHACR